VVSMVINPFAMAMSEPETEVTVPLTVIAFAGVNGGSTARARAWPNAVVAMKRRGRTNRCIRLFYLDQRHVTERRDLVLHLAVVADDHDRPAVRVEVLRGGVLDVRGGELVDALAKCLQK